MVKIIKLILKYILQCKGAGTAKAKFEMQSRTEAKLHDFEIGGETTVGVSARNEAPHVAAAAQHGRRDSVVCMARDPGTAGCPRAEKL